MEVTKDMLIGEILKKIRQSLQFLWHQVCIV